MASLFSRLGGAGLLRHESHGIRLRASEVQCSTVAKPHGRDGVDGKVAKTNRTAPSLP